MEALLFLVVMFVILSAIWAGKLEYVKREWSDLCTKQNFNWYRVCKQLEFDCNEYKKYKLVCCVNNREYDVKSDMLLNAMKSLAVELNVPIGTLSVKRKENEGEE